MTKRTITSVICLTAMSFTGIASQLAFRPSPVIPEKLTKPGIPATVVKDEIVGQAFTGKKIGKATSAVAPEDITGEYTFLINDIYYEDSVGENAQAGWISVDDNGEAELECEGFPIPVPATYDAESATMTFTAVAMGRYSMSNGNAYYIRFEPFYCDYDAEKFVMTDFSVSFDETEHVFRFPEYHGFSWVAYNTEDYDSPSSIAGIVTIFDVVSMTKHIEAWDFYDTATFIDGWLIPAFGRNQYNVPWTVNVDRHKEIPDLYRINSPYTSSGCIIDNYATEGGSIVFDLSDPGHVAVMPRIFCGMVNGGQAVCNTNPFGYALEENEGIKTREEVIADMENAGEAFDTYNAETGKLSFNSCRIQLNGVGCYAWADENNESLAPKMTGSLQFDSHLPSGVDKTITGDANEEVAFYNLQGMRISGDSKGICIMKRNGKTVKTIR